MGKHFFFHGQGCCILWFGVPRAHQVLQEGSVLVCSDDLEHYLATCDFWYLSCDLEHCLMNFRVFMRFEAQLVFFMPSHDLEHYMINSGAFI